MLTDDRDAPGFKIQVAPFDLYDLPEARTCAYREDQQWTKEQRQWASGCDSFVFHPSPAALVAIRLKGALTCSK
jgi:hypothetical protein